MPARSSATPKCRRAEPKKTGVMWPSRNDCTSNGFDASCTSIAPSSTSACSSGSRKREMALERMATGSGWPSSSVEDFLAKGMKRWPRMSSTPLKRPPEPAGQ